jgi:hypothetical protein
MKKEKEAQFFLKPLGLIFTGHKAIVDYVYWNE